LLSAAVPRHVSFLAFCAANVIIDLESVVNILAHRYPIHAWLHTYLGAAGATVATVGLFQMAQWWGRRMPVPDWLGWRELTTIQISIGAAAGAFSHIVLDSVMHSDMEPLAPFSRANPLLGLVSLATLHWFCVACAAAALVLVIPRMRSRSG
jgi:hypothetical protein